MATARRTQTTAKTKAQTKPRTASPDVRVRFARAAEAELHGALPGGVTVQPVSVARWKRAAAGLMKVGFEGQPVDLGLLHDAEERETLRKLDRTFGAHALEHRVLLLRGREVLGCYWGRQEETARYYMVYTVVHPAAQGHGLYTALLERIIAAVRASGFREIHSRHHADNNRVLVPKLKRGFLIAGFDISPRYGLLVNLRFYLNERTRDLHRYRVDATRNGAALRRRKLVRGA
jgi:GNAT superfamily N-acetyltransferase